MIKERQRVDTALASERQNEDSLRLSEQDQKESITESILMKERLETDLNLLDERKEVDKESKRSAETLTEQTGIANTSKSDLAMRDQFLAVVSHDLKNPLSSISMATQIMKDNLKSGDMSDQEAMIEVIDRNAKVMDRMITDLLDVERMTNGKLELNLAEINICDLLTECKIILDPLVKSKGLTLVVDLCEEKLMVKADHDKVLQVLSNLVGNSLKFTAPGGEIKISFQKDPLKISVTDTGVGNFKRESIASF